MKVKLIPFYIIVFGVIVYIIFHKYGFEMKKGLVYCERIEICRHLDNIKNNQICIASPIFVRDDDLEEEAKSANQYKYFVNIENHNRKFIIEFADDSISTCHSSLPEDSTLLDEGYRQSIVIHKQQMDSIQSLVRSPIILYYNSVFLPSRKNQSPYMGFTILYNNKEYNIIKSLGISEEELRKLYCKEGNSCRFEKIDQDLYFCDNL